MNLQWISWDAGAGVAASRRRLLFLPGAPRTAAPVADAGVDESDPDEHDGGADDDRREELVDALVGEQREEERNERAEAAGPHHLSPGVVEAVALALVRLR